MVNGVPPGNFVLPLPLKIYARAENKISKKLFHIGMITWSLLKKKKKCPEGLFVARKPARRKKRKEKKKEKKNGNKDFTRMQILKFQLIGNEIVT